MKLRQLWERCGGLVIAVVTLSMIFSAPVGAAKCSVYALAYPSWYNGLEGCADATKATAGADQPKLEKINDLWIIALNIVQWLIVTAGYVALVMIIWGGFQYIIAQGEPAKIESAKSSLLNAVIGLVIALSAVMIIRTIQGAISGKAV